MKKQLSVLKEKHGQSVVEFALVLPLLLLFFLGMVEIGTAFYDYITLASANREGVRLASRGRFEDEAVLDRVVVSGGIREPEAGILENAFVTTGEDANLGIILTHFPIDENGDLGDRTIVVTGTIYIDGSPVYLPNVSNPQTYSRISGDYEGFHGDITGKINDRRVAEGYDPQTSEIVVIETFFAHRPFLGVVLNILQIPDPMTLYISSSMRVMRDSRID